ncbi:MAG: MarR family transcriptional regulator [Devosia sp.]|jgi:DNA-binding MarR family transcriptional regulator|uniref:MarR family winged helix-turn-helix transcriptional regulator n=1 Tax=Devosia sp. TaxID=1871048 RepID=UPI001A59816F|nr:MarR family transcriptional regulator [Devosia sp.]MBL8597152.1 MarR family transcriptional regulator [Devosia sp.]
MLDGQPKSRLGALLTDAQDAWQFALNQALTRREAPPLGAGAELLAQVSLAGVSQSLLAERMGLTKQAIQQSLDQLEKLALIRREMDPVDRRAKYVVLTQAGLYALELRRDAEKEAERTLRDALGKKALKQLGKGLRKLSAARASTRG